MITNHYMTPDETQGEFIARKELELFHAVIDRHFQMRLMARKDDRENPRPFGADRSSQKSH